MRFKSRSVVGVMVIAWFAVVGAFAEPGTVESIDVQGLSRMNLGAFLHALGVKVGDAYDPAYLRIRFKELWSQGLFQDITFEAEDAPNGGKALIVKIRERPVLSSVTYDDTKVATRTQIEDDLKKRGYLLKIGKAVDMGAVFFAQTAIRDLVAQNGFLDAKVRAIVQEVTETTRAVHFEITPGRKTRIRKITFQGNELFSNRKLRKALELTQPRRWYKPWSQKNLYHPLKWDQDVANLRKLYTNDGYLDVAIRPPVVEVRESKKARRKKQSAAADAGADEASPEPAPEPEVEKPVLQPAPEPAPVEAEPDDANLTPKQLRKRAERKAKQEKKAKKKEQKKAKKAAGKGWVELIVAIDENSQYKLGDVTITGNEKFSDTLLRAAIPLKQGDVLKNNFIEGGVDSITRLYENQGHLYATVVRQINRREGENVADVEVVIEEDRPYYVARIEFTGNSSTQDRVLRRELLISEGDLFSRDRVDVSRLKVNQLGYWQTEADALIEPVPGEDRVNVTLSGQEQGRNEIQVGGGYSGFDGAFFNGVYSTRNFLGRGQVVSTSMQIGGRSSRYQISFQEPWFLSRPILFGVSVRRQTTDYGATLKTDSDGFGIILGRRVGRFAQFNVGYNFDRVSSSTQLISTGPIDDVSSVTTENRISSITPVFSFSSINNPYRPTRGRALNISVQTAGGPLGGDTAFYKPIVRFTGYRRAGGTRYVALHTQVGYVAEWADGSEPNTSNINGVPRYQRYWLGGDTLGPRVFDTRSITPLRYVELNDLNQIVRVLGDPRFVSADDLVTSGGRPVLIEVGGDRFFLVQAEFVLPLNEQAEVALFVDAGDALFEDQDPDFSTTRVSAGVEMRFHLPIFPVPLRLIYGRSVRSLTGDRTSNFQFSIGRSF